MKKSIHGLLCFISVILLFTDCRKKAFDDYYKRPDNLADPIYQQLVSKGDFTNLVKIIDKTSYKETLSSAGSWTFFAPNDAAFQQYFQETGLSGVDAITPEMAEKIVRYSMIYDGEKSDRLSDYLSAKGFVENAAFRRRTLYYDFVYDGKNSLNQDIKVIASNRTGTTGYVTTDFNNKYIPIYLDGFMQPKSLGNVDYQFFYPNSTYTGFNVGPASVDATLRNIVAENGIIHVVDKVLTPPLSIDQYVNSNTNYSSFKNLLDKFVTYGVNADISHKYKVLTGNTNDVFVKYYTTGGAAGLAFSPNNENYTKLDANDAQTGFNSIVVPTNTAIADYAKKVLLKYYPAGTTLNDLALQRSDILAAFINSHMFTAPLWPSRFSNTGDYLGENMKINLSNVIDKKALSNGFFYGVDKVHDANIFSTVYGKVMLDPKFSIMKAALDSYGFSSKLQSPSFKYMLIPISDALLTKLGYSYEPGAFPNNPFRYLGNADNSRLKRIVGTHVIDLNNRPVIPALTPTNTGNGTAGEGFLLTATNEPDNFEYIRFKNNRLYSAGTLDSAYNPITGITPGTGVNSVAIDSVSTGTNGPVVYANGLLMYTDNNVGLSIERYGTLPTDPYYKFFQYLKNSSLYNPVTKQISGVDLGLSYTIFIPTNDQIDEAIKDNLLLPGTVTATQLVIPNYAPTADDDKLKVERFIKYHIINKNTIVADGNILRAGAKETLLKSSLGDPLSVTISQNSVSALQVKDNFGRIANVIAPQGSLLSNRTVIHLIDNYLKYSF